MADEHLPKKLAVKLFVLKIIVKNQEFVFAEFGSTEAEDKCFRKEN